MKCTKFRPFIFISFLLLVFTCCKSVHYSGKKQTKSKREFILKECKKELQDSALFKSVTILPLEANAKKQIGFIDRIYFDGSTIFMLDKKAAIVDIYNKEGHHIKTIQKIGYGSQEFRKLADICVDKVNKELIVLSSEPSKIIYYSYQGEFLREKALPTYFEFITTDGQFIYLLDNNVINGENEMTIYDQNIKQVKETLEAKKQFKGHEISGFTHVVGNVMTQDMSIHITREFDNRIYTAEKGKVFPKYSLNFKESALPKALLDKKMRPSEFFKRCKDNEYIVSITDVIENDNLLLFSTNVGFCVCNKENGMMTKYDYVVDSMTGLLLDRIQTVGNTNEKMAMVWPLAYIKNLMNLRLKNSLDKNINMKFSEQLALLNDEYNAVLVIYEF